MGVLYVCLLALLWHSVLAYRPIRRHSPRPAKTLRLSQSQPILALAATTPSFLSTAFRIYEGWLQRHPWPTKVVSSGVVGGLGDLLVQLLESGGGGRPRRRVDLRRLAVFTAVAALYIAPSIGLWFSFISELPALAGLSPLRKALWMIVLDQTFGAVLINGGFFYAFSLADALCPPLRSPFPDFVGSANRAIRESFWETLRTNWLSWPFINFVNFLYVPLRYRLLFSNFFAVIWNMFLSNIANRK